MKIVKYEKEIRNQILKDSFTKEDLIKEKYLVSKEGKIEIYYAPFDYINLDASIIIVGITSIIFIFIVTNAIYTIFLINALIPYQKKEF